MFSDFIFFKVFLALQREVPCRSSALWLENANSHEMNFRRWKQVLFDLMDES